MKFYSVFDKKAGTFMTPHVAINDAVAERNFISAARDEASMLCTNPEDFSLYHVGSFKEDEGVFLPVDKPVFVCNAPLKANG